MATNGLIDNMSKINYKYTPGNGVAPYSLTSNSNTVTTNINNANLAISKAVDKSSADLSDVVTYTIVLTNSGSINADNVVITDIIPSGAIYKENTLTVAGNSSSANPNTGVNIAFIAPNTSIEVIFQCDITSIPPSNQIVNVSTVSYNYTVETGNIKSINKTSNSVTTQVKHAALNITKSVDKEVADLLDVLTYTITVSNYGNTSANNVVLNDVVPNGATYEPNSIYIDTVQYSGDLSGGVPIGTIEATKSSIIKFKCRITSIPNPSQIINISDVDYNYTVDIGDIRSSSSISNSISTQINHGSLDIAKLVDKSYVDLLDMINYTINITNDGTVPVNNVVVVDIIPNGATCEQDTLLVDNQASLYNPNTGITIETIDVDQTVTIKFLCKVTSIPTSNPMLNTASATFQYNVNARTVKHSNTTSNTIDTTVNHAQLVINKSSNHKYVTELDEIKYTITVKNTGTTQANNVTIVDTLDTSLQFIEGTVTVDGGTHSGSPTTGINIDSIAVNQTVTVEFQVVVLYIPSGNKISNMATANYNYTVEPSILNGKSASDNSNISDIEFVDIYLLIDYLLDFIDEYINTCDETIVIVQKYEFIELLDKTLYVLKIIKELDLGNDYGVKAQIERMEAIINSFKQLMENIKPADSCENILMDARLRAAVIDVILQIISSLELLNGIQTFYTKCHCYINAFANKYVNAVTKLYTSLNTFFDLVGLNNSISYQVNIKPYVPAYSPRPQPTIIQKNNITEFACSPNTNICKNK
ncbi:MAG: DUF7619 domain-containing protein [Peptostreptococcaceae bacterium]